jgi:hypothetical protein
MTFDCTEFRAPNPYETGIFPNLRAAGCHLWIRDRLWRARQARRGATARYPEDHGAAVIQLLTDAKALITAPENWVQGAYRWFRGRRCAVAALGVAAKYVPDFGVVWSAHALLLKVADARRFSSVESMNDHSSHADVLRAFDEAIVIARSQAWA